MFLLISLLVILALIASGFYYWARRQELLTAGHEGAGPEAGRRIPLLTEAVMYVGAVLLLAGAVAAISQQWDTIRSWGHVAIFAAAAAFFLMAGSAVRNVREPAIQRMAGVAWFLSVAGVAGAAGSATLDVHGNPGTYTILIVGTSAAVYAAALWFARPRALQNAALFSGLVVTICGVILAAAARGAGPALAYGLALWAFGLGWAWLGWQRYAEPARVSMALGTALALTAPGFAAGEHGWMYAIAIASAGAAMAASVPLRSTPLLAMGTLAMFGYVTALVLTYFRQALGIPAALAITGGLIISLAAGTARLMRVAHPPEPGEPGKVQPPPTAPPAEPGKPGAGPRRDLPKAS
jgi:hypothetical protein